MLLSSSSFSPCFGSDSDTLKRGPSGQDRTASIEQDVAREVFRAFAYIPPFQDFSFSSTARREQLSACAAKRKGGRSVCGSHLCGVPLGGGEKSEWRRLLIFEERTKSYIEGDDSCQAKEETAPLILENW